jgi:hypothetical protein
MSWKITPGWSPADADAAAYITAVETADNQALENGVKVAIDNFVLGCKADGIWSAIKASCILAGARTLTGALVPLVGTAPTNFNFVSGDYNRKTGLVGDGSTKYLNSNRNNNADPQNSNHNSVYFSQANTEGTRSIIGSSEVTGTSGANNISQSNTNRNLVTRNRKSVPATTVNSASIIGFVGASRPSSGSYSVRLFGSSSSISSNSETPFAGNVTIFTVGSVGTYCDGRIAFYSIGESLDLALLDARVTTLVNAFAAAIP